MLFFPALAPFTIMGGYFMDRIKILEELLRLGNDIRQSADDFEARIDKIVKELVRGD